MPKFPLAVIRSFSPMYASVLTVSTTVETAAPTAHGTSAHLPGDRADRRLATRLNQNVTLALTVAFLSI